MLKARPAAPVDCGSVEGSHLVWTEIQRACWRGSGELAVVSGELSGRVLVQDGKIAWAHLTDPTDDLFEWLAPGGGISVETARAVVRECQSSGTTLGETLVAWGLMDRVSVRNAICGWIARKLDAICRLPAPQVLFLPVYRAQSGEFLFELSEVTPLAWQAPEPCGAERPRRSGRVPMDGRLRGWDTAFAATSDETLNAAAILQECKEVQGLLGVALINRDTRECLGWDGAWLDPDVAWSMLQCVSAAEQAAVVGETIITTSAHLHLAAPLDQRRNVLVYAVVDSTENLAAARHALRRVLRREVTHGVALERSEEEG